MANYNNLKSAIQEVILTNGNNEITGALLQQTLLAMVNSLGSNFQFAGVAIPSTNPGTPDQNVAYIAGPGTYPNFNNTTIPAQYMGVFCYNGTWTYSTFQTSSIAIQTIADDIVQLLDGSTPIYPRTKSSSVFFGNDTNDTLDLRFKNILPKLNIYASQLVRGSLYEGYLDDSVHNCLTTSIYYRVTPGSVIFYSAKHNNQNQTCRYSFYTKDKVFLSMYGYTSLPYVVPENAYFCRVSFLFSNDILPTDISDYELMISAGYDWTFLKGNNGASIAATIGPGKINFDNTNKRVIISGGNISVIRNYERIQFAENSYLDYGTEIRQGTNQAVFLIINKNNALAWLNPSDVQGFESFKECIVLASIRVTTNDVILYNNVRFCATSFQIDGEDSDVWVSGIPSMYPIHSYQLKQGSKYGTFIDGDAKFVATPDMYPIKNTERLFVKVSRANYVNYRIVFYNASGETIENTPYGTTTFVTVPSGAFYFSISVQFSVNTTPNDIIDGDITVSQYINDVWGINSGAKLALPFTRGYLDFDNTNKVVRVTGYSLRFGYNNTVVDIPANTEVSFSELSVGSGYLYYLVLNANNNLEFVIFNENTTRWDILHRYNIIATITITEDQTIKEENIAFITVPYKIDGGVLMDYTIIKDYCALFNTQNPIDSFLFFTDPHLLNNGFELFDKNIYIQALKRYYEATPTSLCICGGDWMDHFDNEDIAAQCLGYIDGYMSKNFNNYLPVVGNHDYNKYLDGQTKLNVQTLINLWYRDKGKTYYYTENKANDSRFYYFDSGIDNDATLMDAYKWEQIDWFATKLQDNIAHNVLFIHISLAYGAVYSEISKNITLIAQAYNARTSITLNGITYDFTNCTGSVHCLISGHKHTDANDILNSIPVVITANLTHSDEPTFDLCAIDYVAKKLNLVRVGAGSSRIINIL